MTPAQNSENTIIINDKIMKELHLTDDMVDELILNTLNSDECEILATRAQSVLFSDLSRATETEDCDDEQIQATIAMSKMLSDVNAYAIEAKNEYVNPASLLLSERRMLEIGEKIESKSYFVILLAEDDDFIVIPNDNRGDMLSYIKKLAEMFDNKMSKSVYYFNGRLGFLFDTNKSWIEK